MWFMALCFIYKQVLLLNRQKFMVNFSTSFVIFFVLKKEEGHIGQEPILPIHKVALSFPQGQKKHSQKQSKKLSPGQAMTPVNHHKNYWFVSVLQ